MSAVLRPLSIEHPATPNEGQRSYPANVHGKAPIHTPTATAAAIRPGDQVVDVGSGTGTISRQRDGLVPSSDSTDSPMGRHR
jgi:hypothetical protein